MFQFEKLQVYKFAVELANEIFKKSITWPQKYQFSLADQLRRAILSISLNIAEGSSRSKKEFSRFLSIARGSCYECVPILDIAQKSKVITGKQYELWYNQLVSIAKMLSALKKSLS